MHLQCMAVLYLKTVVLLIRFEKENTQNTAVIFQEEYDLNKAYREFKPYFLKWERNGGATFIFCFVVKNRGLLL